MADVRETIFEFEIPRVGWEMDNHARIEQSCGRLTIVTTNHGSPCEMSKQELDRHIDEVTKWKEGLLKAKATMRGA